MLRFGVGARVWLREIMERDGVDAASALFSESTGRVIVTVPREDDVKFRGLCDGRGYPVLRIGVTDAPGEAVPRWATPEPPARWRRQPALEVQGVFTVPLAELRDLSTLDLPARLRRDRLRAVRRRLTPWRTKTSTATTTTRARSASRSIAWVVIVSLILVGGGATVLALLFG